MVCNIQTGFGFWHETPTSGIPAFRLGGCQESKKCIKRKVIMSIKNVLSSVSRSNLTNNTQRVALRLLKADGQWVSRRELERNISNVASRIRDLRKAEFGGFVVECASAAELNRRANPGAFYYRIQPSTVTKSQLATVFRI